MGVVGVEHAAPSAGAAAEDLEAAGWVRRFEADTARLEEVVELYISLGCEVTIRALEPQSFAPECAGCALTACARYVEVYTRPAARAGA
ncbi:MAG: hypothetical protein M0Z33_03640 [Actinomycetota bacterium]|nr:hypothetical protein [Actinomycetota bacterium]